MNCRIGSSTTKKSGESRDPIRRGGEGKVAMTCRIIVHFINMFGKGSKEGNKGERSLDGGNRCCRARSCMIKSFHANEVIVQEIMHC